MNTVAGVITFKAKPGKGAEVGQLIAAALPAVNAESGTPLWLVLRSDADPDQLFLVDLFSNAASRDSHMGGKAADLIFKTVPPLLASEPAIHAAQLVASKGAEKF
ncbi:MAG: antibiotic biosynthesis monooxygenase [Beijerinckiaceae bacterium]|nr:MAG: antibiotic biosynthesis monooxygenase [Beijerinckiaceae bacterium]